MLDEFHADDELQRLCKEAHDNAERYLTLETAGDNGQRYIARIDVPPDTLLAVYSGSLEKACTEVQDTLRHSMHMGILVFKYELYVDGTPRLGDGRPGRMQLINHACAPYHNSVCVEWTCPSTGLQAYLLRSRDVPHGVEAGTKLRFPYQEVVRKKGVQEYSANGFWKQAATLRPLKTGEKYVRCNCAGTTKSCPNGYGRIERMISRPRPTPPHTTALTHALASHTQTPTPAFAPAPAPSSTPAPASAATPPPSTAFIALTHTSAAALPPSDLAPGTDVTDSALGATAGPGSADKD